MRDETKRTHEVSFTSWMRCCGGKTAEERPMGEEEGERGTARDGEKAG